ncbi:MAG TPA: hypothetical protein PK904_08650 [Bacteroidales bacterium]|nr:hypothetical protein [Bacteroidales bacterium]
MTILEIIFILLGFSFAIFVTVGQVKILYRRHIKSYQTEIENFLKRQGLSLLTVNSPNKNDWKNSPFIKPGRFGIKLGYVQINGVVVIWNDQRYKLIQTNEGITIWLEIDTTYFKKPILTFRAGKKRKPTEMKNRQQNENIKNVTETCPACGFRLHENDFECPDCGLNFR